MAYISYAQLAERPGARELAEVASPAHEPMVPYELMELALQGEDMSSYTAEEISRATAALARIDDAVTDATALIDGYLATKGYLPLDPVPTIVTAWCRAIARYLLHQDLQASDSTNPIIRDYQDALSQLKQTANGTFSLGFDDPVQSDPNQLDVRFTTTPSAFNRQQLERFR